MVISSRYTLFFKVGSKYIIYMVILRTEATKTFYIHVVMYKWQYSVVWSNYFGKKNLEEYEVEIVKNLSCNSELKWRFFIISLESEFDVFT